MTRAARYVALAVAVLAAGFILGILGTALTLALR